MSFKTLKSSKPLVNITMLGASHHGKSTVLDALKSVVGGPGKRKIRTAYVPFESKKNLFHYYDFSGRDLATRFKRSNIRFNAAVLVVSADKGPTAETWRQLMLAKKKGVKPVVVFLNQFGTVGKPLLQKRMKDMRRMLDASGWGSKDVKFLSGPAAKLHPGFGKQAIQKLFAETKASAVTQLAGGSVSSPRPVYIAGSFSFAPSPADSGGSNEAVTMPIEAAELPGEPAPKTSAASRPRGKTRRRAPVPRVVNAQVEERTRAGRRAVVDPKVPLRPRCGYMLAVQIGALKATSQVENPPVIEKSLKRLRPGETHWPLEVVVFGKDFTVTTQSVQRLRLPRVGESRWVRFGIRTPATRAWANLRFAIYCRNHLVQSFALSSPIGGQTEGVRLRIVCDFAQSGDFTNLEKLRPRVLSLGLNHDLGGGTHRLFVKGTSIQRMITLDEKWMTSKAEAFRRLLAAHVIGHDNYARMDSMTAEERTQEFDAVIRELAVLGNELFRGLFVKATQLVWQMLKVPELPIQIARMSSEHAYPWPILYDFPLPEPSTGELKAPVCRGRKGDAPCECDGKSAGCYCLRGFWGFRHQIEEIVSPDGSGPAEAGDGNAPTEAKPRDAATTVAPPPRPVSLGLLTDREEDMARLGAWLKEEFGRQFVDLNGVGSGPRELLDALWKENSRPSVVVAFGHLEPVVQGTEVKATKFSLRDGAWLSSDDVWSKAMHGGPWGSPPSLVLLMMCKSGEVTIGAVNDFAQPFILAGSSGVIAAETYIFPEQAAELVRSILGDLRAGKRMGEAMQRYWQARAAAGDPFGFSFFYLGPADLTLS